MLIQSGGWTHTNYEMVDGIARSADTYYYPKGLLLFNLDTDMGETTNLADRYPDLVLELSAACENWKSNMLPPRRGEERMTTTKSMLK